MIHTALSVIENNEIDKIFNNIGCKQAKVKTDFKERFAKLQSEDERKLILDLTSRFTYIPLSEYGNHLIKSINDFIRAADHSKIIGIMNGFHKSDFGKVKSNYLVSYQFKGLNLIKNINWPTKYPRIIDNSKSLLKINNLQDYNLVLVDDFLGSGETIEGAYNYMSHRLKAHNKPMPYVSVVCIVAMQHAVDLLSTKMRINVYASKILKRGISDFYTGNDLKEAKSLMKEIERRIKVRDNFRFGYKQSEALVCMERCPNNTFPFYWFNDKYGNPPFRR